MKAAYLLFIGFLIISCKENTSAVNEKTISDSSKVVVPANVTRLYDTVTWIHSFREFRDAVYQGNKTKVKAFFDFPVMNETNEIWYLVYDQNEKQLNQLTGNIKPFTEPDFDKYFDKLFSKHFTRSILKLKSEDLNKKQEIETSWLKEGNISYKMYATVDKGKETLTLHLSSDTVIKDDNGEVQDGGEFSIMYTFSIIENRRLKFKQVRLAG